MAKLVVWSQKAQNDRKKILTYWVEHNKSKTYSIKLNELFKYAVKLIAKYPGIGKLTDSEGIRAKIVRDYYIFYQLTEKEIHILSIWDTRQDPDKLENSIQ